jgi:hypothetical protein
MQRTDNSRRSTSACPSLRSLVLHCASRQLFLSDSVSAVWLGFTCDWIALGLALDTVKRWERQDVNDVDNFLDKAR